MHIHILGIGGTFMGGIAIIAKQLGHRVSGMDKNIYPPMSTQLAKLAVDLIQGYAVADLPKADLYIIGNVLSRGNACIEEILNQQYHYISAPQWLGENVLSDKYVLAVSGTHGKTSTAAMLAWILEYAGFNPGYLVGGAMSNFAFSARLSEKKIFVIEADEYDSAFFDKRSKFMHYHPNMLIINNIEFDHGDIFKTLADIQKQFAHLLRIMPSTGLIIYPENDTNIEAVLDQGCWTPKVLTKLSLKLENTQSGSRFQAENTHAVNWSLLGVHNANNARQAIKAANYIGINTQICTQALGQFKGVKRRLELIYENKILSIYDDFAHHPSAIAATLNTLKVRFLKKEIIALVELASNTMKNGLHTKTLITALEIADQSYILSLKQETTAKLQSYIKGTTIKIYADTKSIINALACKNPRCIVIMSNSHFQHIHEKIIALYENKNSQNTL